MKSITRTLCAIAVLAVLPQTVLAAVEEDRNANPAEYWLTIDEVPNSALLLPLPPSWTDQQFAYDQARYIWGRQQRDTPRGALAVTDADITPKGVAYTFSEPFGMEISETNTPELWALLVPSIKCASKLAVRSAKKGYMRTRPYVMYETGTCNPTQEEELRTNGSFPSGHSTVGMMIALLLSEVNPEQSTQLLQTGFRMGESRVICGYHWQSDVDAGRLAGPGAYAALHQNEGFMKQLGKAKEEFKKMKAAGKYTKPDPNRDFKDAAK